MDWEFFFNDLSTAHLSIADETALLEILQRLKGPEEVFLQVQLLKDEGNYMFKQVNVQGALECYEKAIKLLTYILPSGNGFLDEL